MSHPIGVSRRSCSPLAASLGLLFALALWAPRPAAAQANPECTQALCGSPQQNTDTDSKAQGIHAEATRLPV